MGNAKSKRRSGAEGAGRGDRVPGARNLEFKLAHGSACCRSRSAARVTTHLRRGRRARRGRARAGFSTKRLAARTRISFQTTTLRSDARVRTRARCSRRTPCGRPPRINRNDALISRLVQPIVFCKYLYIYVQSPKGDPLRVSRSLFLLQLSDPTPFRAEPRRWRRNRRRS